MEPTAQRILELGRLLYPLIRPWRGIVEDSDANPLLPGDIRRRPLRHIGWANFFGPEYVLKLGKDFLLKAPGWKTEELADGGILYVLSPSLAGTGPRAVVEEVKRYFGVESVRRRQKQRKHSR